MYPYYTILYATPINIKKEQENSEGPLHCNTKHIIFNPPLTLRKSKRVQKAHCIAIQKQ